MCAYCGGPHHGGTLEQRQAGRARKAAAGGKVGGRYPYGYRADGYGRNRRGHGATRDPKEYFVVRLIIGMRQGGSTFQSIAETLDDLGHHPRKAQRWTRMTVQRIFERETKAR